MQLNAEAGLGWHLIGWRGQGFRAVMDAMQPPLRIFHKGVSTDKLAFSSCLSRSI